MNVSTKTTSQLNPMAYEQEKFLKKAIVPYSLGCGCLFASVTGGELDFLPKFSKNIKNALVSKDSFVKKSLNRALIDGKIESLDSVNKIVSNAKKIYPSYIKDAKLGCRILAKRMAKMFITGSALGAVLMGGMIAFNKVNNKN